MSDRGGASLQIAELGRSFAVGARSLVRNHNFVIGAVLAMLLFLGAHPAPFPFYNQNTYFLQGLASSGYGALSDDWLSNTATPFVVFSAIVAALNGIGILAAHHGVEFLLILAFATSCAIIADCCRSDVPLDRSAKSLVALVILVLVTYRPFMVQGMAGQYALGRYLQPSEFGVLLILSVALFAANRSLAAYALAALAGVFHQSYLLPGAMLVVCYLAHDVMIDRKRRQPAIGAVVALAIVAPISWYSAATFAGAGGEMAEQSRWILAEMRLHHHARPEHWFNTIELLKMVTIGLAIPLSAFVNRRLAFVMATSAALGALASGAAILSDSNTFYLLFPWRISVVLMPLATIVLAISLVRIVARSPLARFAAGPWVQASIVLLGVAIAAQSYAERSSASAVHGAGAAVGGWPQQEREAEYLDLVSAVRGSLAPGQLYLHTPERFESFRIRTGAPVYVDFKSHPYRDDEVAEWWSRLTWAWSVFGGGRACDGTLLREMADRRITHLIIDKATDGMDARAVADCLRHGSTTAAVIYDNLSYSIVRLP